MDPGVLLAEPEQIREHVRRMLDELAQVPYVVNLGHGMWPEHNPEHVKVFVEEVKKWKRQ